MDEDERTRDLELLRRCADGDDAAWSDFLRRYGAFLDYMVRRALASGGRLPGPAEVADVRDDVLAWLLEHDGRVLRTYRGESKLTSWIGVVVGRRARRVARRGAGLAHRTVSLDALTAEATSHLAVETRAGPSPREAAIARLGEAVEKLSDRDRALIRGAFYERRSYEELAAELGVRTDSIGQLLFRAKQRLRKHLGDGSFLEALSGLLLALLSWGN